MRAFMAEQKRIPKYTGRVEFLSHLEFISKEVAKGECYKRVYQKLKTSQNIKMSYSTFHSYAVRILSKPQSFKMTGKPKKEHKKPLQNSPQSQELTPPPKQEENTTNSITENTPSKKFKIHVAATANQPNASSCTFLPENESPEAKTFKFNKLPDVDDLLK